MPDGTYSYLGFYDTFLRPVIEAGVAADITLYTPLIQWWTCVFTETNAHVSLAVTVPIAPANICQHCLLDRWVSTIVDLPTPNGTVKSSGAFHLFPSSLD